MLDITGEGDNIMGQIWGSGTGNWNNAAIVDNNGRLWMSIGSGTAVAGIDTVSSTLPVIQLEHYKVHKGKYFTVTEYDGDVDIVAPKVWHVSTPDNTLRAHVIFAISSDTAGLVELWEGPTITNSGTGLTPRNNDRTATDATSFKFWTGPTVTTSGILIQTDRIGTYKPQTRVGGNLRQYAEFILAQKQSYLLKFTTDADNGKVTFNGEYYEV